MAPLLPGTRRESPSSAGRFLLLLHYSTKMLFSTSPAWVSDTAGIRVSDTPPPGAQGISELCSAGRFLLRDGAEPAG